MSDEWFWKIMTITVVMAILSVSVRVSQVADAIKANNTCTQHKERK